MDLPLVILITTILGTAMRESVPLAFATFGGVFSERSGIINVALDGMMLLGAFFGVVGAYYTQNVWLGVLIGTGSGLFFALILGFLIIVLDADQIICGFALNILAAGITRFLMQVIFHVQGNTPIVPSFEAIPIPYLSALPVLGSSLFSQSILGYLAITALPLVWWFLYRTPLGLRLRSSGENPAAVDSAGINVNGMRMLGLGLSGIMAGIAGTYMAMSQMSQFIEGMTVGRGFIALAIVYLGGWNPLRGALAALVFGLAEAISYQVGQNIIPNEFVLMLPYVLTILVLAGFGGRAVAPAAEGKSYHTD
jgi:general nucleoside transport system permease protein